jgi:hypothetical protein
VLASLAVLLVAGCSQARVPLPSDSAPPAAVLDAYLRALELADCQTAIALTAPGYESDTRSFCGVGNVTGYHISTGDPAMPGGGEVIFAAQVTTANGVIYPDGVHDLFFGLKQQDGGPWRLVGGGTGP